MTIPHPSGDDKCRIMDLVFLYIPKKPTSSTVLIIVMVVFHNFSVFTSEPVEEDTAVGGRVRIYTNFAVHILHILYRMYYGADRRELGPVFHNWIRRFNFKRVQFLRLLRCDLECVSICDDWNLHFVGRTVLQKNVVSVQLCRNILPAERVKFVISFVFVATIEGGCCGEIKKGSFCFSIFLVF